MRAWNLSVALPNRPGELAKLATALGDAKVDIEGFFAVDIEDRAFASFLVSDRTAARGALERLGHRVEREMEVVVEALSDETGELGRATQLIADAGINLTVSYVVGGSRVVFGADDLPALERALGVKEIAAT